MKKNIVLSAMITTLSATSVMAQTNPVAVITPIMTDASAAAVFAEPKVENIQAMELSTQEMKDTQGAFAPYIIAGGLGGIYGGLGYLGSSTATGNFTWSGFATAFGIGAVSGVVGGGPIASAAGRYLAPRTAYFGGFVQGMVP